MATQRPSTRYLDLYVPKLVTVFREGYHPADLRADAISGLTVAIVALPLSMAIAIASGVTPDRGLFAAIVGGFLVSLLGGSRFQIGGPAGAFIVLVAGTVQTFGVEGLLLATLMSGIFLVLIGFLGLGTFIKYIPYPVTVGFTAGIAVIIFSSQIKDLLGLVLTEREPSELIHKIGVLGPALPTINLASVLLAAISIAIIVVTKKFRPHWPNLLIAVATVSIIAWLLKLPAATIGTAFGGIPQTLPAPQLPAMGIEKIQMLLPAALSFTLLGSIESLLSAVVADSMTGRRHRSNAELVAQGVANIGSAFFGGICVTGTIARTATNVRSGARSPISGMLHSIYLLLFMLIAAPIASFIPLAALAGVLTTVAWNMAERHAFASLLRTSRGDAVVLLVTFLLTIFKDLMFGITAGFVISTMLFLHRMTTAVQVERGMPLIEDDISDAVADANQGAYNPAVATDPAVVVYRISGAFFFGAAANVSVALDNIGESPRAYVIDFSAVPMVDSTAASTVRSLISSAGKRSARVYLSSVSSPVHKVLLANGITDASVTFSPTIGEAISLAHRELDLPLKVAPGEQMPSTVHSSDARATS